MFFIAQTTVEIQYSACCRQYVGQINKRNNDTSYKWKSR